MLGVLITASTSLLITGLVVCSISSRFSLGRSYLSKNSLLSSRLSLLLQYICLEDSGTSWGEPRCLSLPGGPGLFPHPGGGSCPTYSVHHLDAAGIPFSLKPDSEHQMGFVLQQISGNHGGDWKLIPRYSRDSFYTRTSIPRTQHSRLCYLNTGMGRGLKLCYRQE